MISISGRWKPSKEPKKIQVFLTQRGDFNRLGQVALVKVQWNPNLLVCILAKSLASPEVAFDAYRVERIESSTKKGPHTTELVAPPPKTQWLNLSNSCVWSQVREATYNPK